MKVDVADTGRKQSKGISRTAKAKRMGLVEIRADLQPFDYPVQFIIGPHDKAVEWVGWLYDEDLSHEKLSPSYGKCFEKAGWLPVVWIPRRPRTPREYNTLAHECLHATFKLFRWGNFPMDDSTEEIMGHVVGHLVDQCLEGLRGR